MESRLGRVLEGARSFIPDLLTIHEIKTRPDKVRKESLKVWSSIGGPTGESVTIEDVSRVLQADLEWWRAEHALTELHHGKFPSPNVTLLEKARDLQSIEGRQAAQSYFSYCEKILQQAKRVFKNPPGSREESGIDKNIRSANAAVRLLSE